MEENATRAIMIGVGLFIVLLTISGILLYVNAARSMATVVDKGLNSWDDISYNNIMDYNGDVTIECTGIDLINFIRKYVGRDDIYLNVTTKDNEGKYEDIASWKNQYTNNASEEKLTKINADSKITMKKTIRTDSDGVKTYYIKAEYEVSLPVSVKAYRSKEDAKDENNAIGYGENISVGSNTSIWVYYSVKYSDNDVLQGINIEAYANGSKIENKVVSSDDRELDKNNCRYIYAVCYGNLPVGNVYATAKIEYKKLPPIQATSNRFNIGNGSSNPGTNPGGNVLYGDVNGDGVVDENDLITLRRYFAGWDVQINEQNADLNGDGEITKADLLRLKKYLAGWV